MVVTKKAIADMLIKYINRKIDLPNLVNWAENYDKRSRLREWEF